jgi:hypothetical protein
MYQTELPILITIWDAVNRLDKLDCHLVLVERIPYTSFVEVVKFLG